MSKIDVHTWLSDGEQVALSFTPSGLKAIFSRSFTVPPKTMALLLEGESQVGLAQAGEVVSDFQEAFLVKLDEFSLSFQFVDFLTKDNHTMEVDMEIAFQITPQETFIQLLRHFCNGRDHLSKQGIRREFRKSLKEGLAHFIASRPAEDLYKEDLKASMESVVREALGPVLLDSGLDMVGLGSIAFFSESFERVLDRERQRLVIQEEHKNKEMLQDMQKRLVLQEVNAAQEAEQLKKHLAYKGVLEELELRAELKKKKQDKNLQNYQEIYEKMGQDEIKALIFLLEDEKIKAELINGLIEKDMTEEQLAAKKQKDFQKEMEEKLNQFTSQLNKVMQHEGQMAVQKGPYQTRRVYVSCGQEIIAFDPKTNRLPEQPKEVYDFQGRGLGYLRSVRVLGHGTLLAGGQKGVYFWTVGKDDLLKEFVFPRESRGRGGVNSMAIQEDSLMASHSEQGIVVWDLLGIKSPSYILSDVTRGVESVRGLTSVKDKIYFSVDNQICCSQSPFEKAIFYKGSSSSLTTFVVWEDLLIAGNTDGRILKWNLSDPTSPSELNLRKASPIYMLKVIQRGDRPYLLIGAKDYAVQALSLATEKTVEFQAKEAIRWVDGSSDYIYGVDRSMYKIFVWAVDKPTQPLLIWRLPDKAQDIVVVQEEVR